MNLLRIDLRPPAEEAHYHRPESDRLFSAVMARLNYFEWMFHPVDSARFETQAESKLDNGEMILAVRLGPDARAYPILQMAYHHVLNDVVNGVPIAATY